MATAQLDGLDTTEPLSAVRIRELAKLKPPIKFVIKYCSNSAMYANKRLTHAERADCTAAGIANGFVFERGNTIDYFVPGKGTEDAAIAIAYFALLGVPAGQKIACYFAVDFDAAIADLNGRIMVYAREFHTAMTAAGFLTGVYGSGATCRELKNAGFVHFTWKAQSTGWGGYSFIGWDIRQGMGSVAGLSSDPDVVADIKNAGFWLAEAA